ncbi:Disease resistance protein RPS5, partial [Mucuna pruriens]
VVDCKAVEVIFEINDSQPINVSKRDTNLQLIIVHGLSNLKQVWSRDPGGILNFENLRSIVVIDCQKLRNVFPASVAKDVRKLEYMSVQWSDGMVEIVEREDESEANIEPLVFPELTYFELHGLSNIEHFYEGRHTIECPKLKQLTVLRCWKLKTFRAEISETTNEVEKAVFSAEKVIPHLEHLEIDFDVGNWLQSNIEKYQMHRLKGLCLHSVHTVDYLYQFLCRMPNLERLNLFSSDSLLKKLVPSANIAPQDRLGTVLQLKELVLWDSKIKDIGFERDPVLQRLELLSLGKCYELRNLAPPSVSFIYLTYLEVINCEGLENLMASSTAKSLVQLKTLKVIQCQVKEIVINEGNEKDDKEIVFSNLITIELVSLKYLKSFCSNQRFQFKFPSLEILIVRECPMMETFTVSHASAPKLQNILAVHGEQEAKWQWAGDLNATIQKVFKDKVGLMYTKDLNLSEYPEFIEQLWHHNYLVQQNNFRNLRSLEAVHCNKLVHVIPSHLLPCFENLEELKVWGCSAAQVIFNMNENRETKALGNRIIRLKKLSLAFLPKLEHVWDKDPEGIISLQVLQDMRVESCDYLKSLFPASVAKDLTRLEVLSVTYCSQLVEIFAKDEKAAGGTTKMFKFSSLTSLMLIELPGLKYFYPGLHMLEWPVLEQLEGFHCELVKLKCPEDNPEEQLILIQIEKVIQIPSMKRLCFGIGDIKVIWEPESGQLQFEELQHFQQDSDSTPLYRFLDMLPRIKNLAFSRCLFEELFSAERPNADYTRILLHLKELKLYIMENLKSIGFEHSWLHSFPENLQILQVEDCHSLINLVPCTVSFSNLTHLKVSRCNRLLYLFTSSTAKSLARLERVEIDRCDSLQEIVFTEGIEPREGEQIIFEKLQVLYLKELPQVWCFYPGNCTLRFPSLKKVYMINCSRMKTFSPVNIIHHSTDCFYKKDATPQQEYDLNSAVRRIIEEKFLEYARGIFMLFLKDEDRRLQEIWQGSQPIPNLCFSNLHLLTVDGCQFLSNAVIPIYLLPFLTKLEEVTVQNCSSVKTIFDVKCITQDRIMTFPLKRLTLSKLPNLENVWNEDPHGILSMQLLQVSVDNCKCLKSLFPPSVAKDLGKLQNLVVKHCEGLMEIVAEDNVDPKISNLELMFPCMVSLTLWDLPKFKYFYYCSLQFDMLETFTDLEPHAEDQVCIEKVSLLYHFVLAAGSGPPTPDLLQCLSVSENGLKMIRNGEFQGNHLHKLKVLTLLCFHTETNVFPCGFLQEVPNIEKLEVSCSSFKEIFCFQSPIMVDTGLLSQLKVLHLESLHELVSIGFENSWIEPFLRNLETLGVISCSRLSNLAPSPVCFSNLMCLVVSECHGLVYLFTSSTAKSLAQLKRMEIKNCESIEEIVSKEEDESPEDEQIIFKKLQILYLIKLDQLRCFYPGNCTLHFPSLKEVQVVDCSWMKTFSPVNIIDHPTKWISANPLDVTPQQECDLNSAARSTFGKMFSEFARIVDRLFLRNNPLQEIWKGSWPIPDWCFSELNHLIVEGCQFLSDSVLPFTLLPLFTKLEILEVRNCDYVKTIFDVKCITQDRIMTTVEPAIFPLPFPLKKLILARLPNLENVWNEDPHGILCMQLLQQVYVDNCKCLTSLFPASVAKDLAILENLVVQHCEGLMAIVAEDNAETKGPNPELTFPFVKTLTLLNLPKFKFNATTTFELTPNLHHLILGDNEAKMIWHGEFQGNQLHKLKFLSLAFHFESNIFPYEFLQVVPNIEKLGVYDGSLKEIFCCQSPNVNYTGFLPQLKILSLVLLPELISIGLENSWIEPILRNLQTLEVIRCFRLRNIASPPVRFSNLMCLIVLECHRLENLFTSSTAKSLSQLRIMEIKCCESIKEILSKEGDGSHEDEIIFWQLHYLNLESLPNLVSFYTGNLSFPSLEQLSVINCHRMETLCSGTINAAKLFGVKFQNNSDVVPLEIDLNSTIRKAFLATGKV